MNFCGEDDVEEFFRSVPEFERMLVRCGIQLGAWGQALGRVAGGGWQVDPTP